MKSLECLTQDCINLLCKNNLLMPLIKSELINELIYNVTIEKEQKDKTVKDFSNNLKLTDPELVKSWLSEHRMNLEEFENLALKNLKLKKYCKENFSHKVESRFLERKNDLDIVTYSLIRVKTLDTANELFLRLTNNESEFGELASEFSMGIEKGSRGVVGPVQVSQAHPQFAYLLRNATPGEIQNPIHIADQYLVFRVESYEAAQLNQLMRERMSEELLTLFLANQVNELMHQLMKDPLSKEKSRVTT